MWHDVTFVVTPAVVKALGFCGKGMHVVTSGTATAVRCECLQPSSEVKRIWSALLLHVVVVVVL